LSIILSSRVGRVAVAVTVAVAVLADFVQQ
jgi:hypothetical protein